MIELHSLKRSSRRYKPKRLGRGNSSGKGTTAGRGTKGQRARTRRGLKATIERTPKTRGFRSRRQAVEAVTILQIEQMFDAGVLIGPQELWSKGLIRSPKSAIKIIGNGALKKKLTIKADGFSKGAEAAITKAGGTVAPVHPQTTK